MVSITTSVTATPTVTPTVTHFAASRPEMEVELTAGKRVLVGWLGEREGFGTQLLVAARAERLNPR